MFAQFWKLSAQLMLAQIEAQQVVGLRMMKLAAGGKAAQTESVRMVTEKVAAAAQAGTALAGGKSAQSVVRRYRTIMRANRKRLNKR